MLDTGAEGCIPQKGLAKVTHSPIRSDQEECSRNAVGRAVSGSKHYAGIPGRPSDRRGEFQLFSMRSVEKVVGSEKLCGFAAIENNAVVGNWCQALGAAITMTPETQSGAHSTSSAAPWEQALAGPCVSAAFPQDKQMNEVTAQWYARTRETIGTGKPVGFGPWAGENVDNAPNSIYWFKPSSPKQYLLCSLAEQFDCSSGVCVPSYTEAQLALLKPVDTMGHGPCRVGMGGISAHK